MPALTFYARSPIACSSMSRRTLRSQSGSKLTGIAVVEVLCEPQGIVQPFKAVCQGHTHQMGSVLGDFGTLCIASGSMCGTQSYQSDPSYVRQAASSGLDCHRPDQRGDELPGEQSDTVIDRYGPLAAGYSPRVPRVCARDRARNRNPPRSTRPVSCPVRHCPQPPNSWTS